MNNLNDSLAWIWKSGKQTLVLKSVFTVSNNVKSDLYEMLAHFNVIARNTLILLQMEAFFLQAVPFTISVDTI